MATSRTDGGRRLKRCRLLHWIRVASAPIPANKTQPSLSTTMSYEEVEVLQRDRGIGTNNSLAPTRTLSEIISIHK